MRLIDPGPGELLDRLTILGLKIKAAAERGRSTRHFREEHEQIVRLLDGWILVSPMYQARAEEWARALAEANAQVWLAIDEQRAAKLGRDEYKPFLEGALAKLTLQERVAIGVHVAYWGEKALDGNDDRAAIIHEINRACSQREVGEEKVPAGR